MRSTRRPPARDSGKDQLPQTPMQLTGYLARLALEFEVVGSWSKTFQFALLIFAPIGTLAILAAATAVAFVYLKLDPNQWGLVAASAIATATGTSVAWAGGRAIMRRRHRHRVTSAESPPAGENPEP